MSDDDHFTFQQRLDVPAHLRWKWACVLRSCARFAEAGYAPTRHEADDAALDHIDEARRAEHGQQEVQD